MSQFSVRKLRRAFFFISGPRGAFAQRALFVYGAGCLCTLCCARKRGGEVAEGITHQAIEIDSPFSVSANHWEA